MSTSSGPQVTTSGLLLEFDAGNPASLNGVVQNLLTSPENLTVAPWGTFGSNTYRNANVTTAPDGTVTADELGTTSWVSGDSVYQDFTIGAGNGTKQFTLSVFAKAGVNAPSITFAEFYTGSSTEGFSFSFNPSTGAITGGTGTVVAYPNGWYRAYFTVTGTIAANTTLRYQVYLNTTGSVYLWGAQLEYGSSVSTYYPVNATTQPSVLWTNLTNTEMGYNLTQVQALIVAGGGGGGTGGPFNQGGGGGGGGVIPVSAQAVVPGTSYTIVVGAGGAALVNGSNTTAFGYTALGGGAGGAASNGANGGSGGGAGSFGAAGTYIAGGISTVTAPQLGFKGGEDPAAGTFGYNAAGGGGAGGPGLDVISSATGSNGGPGYASSISGATVYYGAGGGGSGSSVARAGLGGSATAGNGGSGLNNTLATSGTAGTGSGGGGGVGAPLSSYYYTAGAGGAGTVVIAYPLPVRATGGTITIVGNTVVHTFTTGTSTFTVNGATTYLLNTPIYANYGSAKSLVFNGTNTSGLLSAPYLNNFYYSGKSIFVAARMDPRYTTLVYRGFNGAGSLPRNFNFYMYLDATGYRLHYSAKQADGTNGGWLSNYLTVTTNQWFTAAVTQSTTAVTFYFNGVAVGTTAGTGFVAQYDATAGQEYIGRNDTYWYGDLAYFSLYNQALTSANILQNHVSLRGRYGI
jgi:hypothetical protein